MFDPPIREHIHPKHDQFRRAVRMVAWVRMASNGPACGVRMRIVA